jgi:hypothetical protein
VHTLRDPRKPLVLLTLVSLGLLLSALAPTAAFAKRTIGISTPSFQFNVPAGGSGKGDIVIINDGDETMTVLIYTANQKVDAKGNIQFDVPNRDTQDILGSPAMWIRLALPKLTRTIGNTSYIDMKPGDRVPVGFEFTVPADAPAGDHPAVIFFEMVDLNKNKTGSVSQVSGRVGSRLRIRVQGQVNENVEVSPFSARQFVIGDMIPYVFTIRNRGNIDQFMTGTMTILDSNDAEKYRAQVLTESTVFAATDKEVSGTLRSDNVWLGRYVLRLDASYPRTGKVSGSQDLQHIIKERTLWVAPLWLVVIAIVVIGLLVLWVIWRRAVAQARREAATQSAARPQAVEGVGTEGE